MIFTVFDSLAKYCLPVGVTWKTKEEQILVFLCLRLYSCLFLHQHFQRLAIRHRRLSPAQRLQVTRDKIWAVLDSNIQSGVPEKAYQLWRWAKRGVHLDIPAVQKPRWTASFSSRCSPVRRLPGRLARLLASTAETSLAVLGWLSVDTALRNGWDIQYCGARRDKMDIFPQCTYIHIHTSPSRYSHRKWVYWSPVNINRVRVRVR